MNADNTPSAESKPKVNIIGKFQKLPSGVQRLIIGVLVIVMLLVISDRLGEGVVALQGVRLHDQIAYAWIVGQLDEDHGATPPCATPAFEDLGEERPLPQFRDPQLQVPGLGRQHP